MEFKKIESGIYKSENGYTIVKKVPMNMFTGRPMGSSETRWYIYDDNHNKVDFAFTLKEAKEIVAKL